MPYNESSPITIEGTVWSKSFESAEADICTSIEEFLGHRDFNVNYTVRAERTVGGHLIGYHVGYTAWSNI